jgi:hypothetical protein
MKAGVEVALPCFFYVGPDDLDVDRPMCAFL